MNPLLIIGIAALVFFAAILIFAVFFEKDDPYASMYDAMVGRGDFDHRNW